MSTPSAYPAFTGSEPCAQIGTDYYFTQDDKPTYDNLHIIKEICHSCPSRTPCLEYALHVNVLGIWGGTVEHERKKIRRARGIVPVPLAITYDIAPVSRDALKHREARAARKQIA